MRFMHFRAHDKYALHLSKMEKVLPQELSLVETQESFAAFLALVTLMHTHIHLITVVHLICFKKKKKKKEKKKLKKLKKKTHILVN